MMVEPSEVTDMDLYLMQHGQATTETEESCARSRLRSCL